MPESPSYLEAINRALRDELARDDRVVLLGVDVGESGGVYGVTRGLHEQFPGRVLDTPIAEAGVLGAGVGAAMTGLRPVAEIMYMDFVTVCMDPIINQAAKLRYMTGGGATMPIVFRTQTGGGRSGGAQHSQSLEAMLAHVPGLRVFVPSDARDAYDLLVAAIRDDSPVCFVENRRLYPRRIDDWARPPLPPGRARVVRPGTDLTVISWGRMVSETLRALGSMDDVSAELIDLRTLAPLDLEPVFASVRKTGRCLVVHEAVEAFGAGAEIAARVADEVLYELDGPIARFGAQAAPVPYSPVLESHMLPTHQRIAARVREVAAA
jgi:pyruvate/2-oxoglutarate/acetoin dehydrogenase E1 component